MSNIIDSIQLSGTVYTIQGTGGGGNPTVELTQAEYDALVTAGTVSANTYYIITDAQAGDLTQYWTSAQTQSAITSATSGKVNTSSVVSSVTSASTDNEIPTAKAVWEAASGGGKAIEAGRGISITTGETADTVSFNLPISAGTSTNSIAEGSSTTASGNHSHAEGNHTTASGDYSHAEGVYTKTSNRSEHASGQYNKSVSASTTFGDSGNTLFSVGNGANNTMKHNAFEIRQNGDIYISSGGTTSSPMIKLQDALEGGGTTYTAGRGIDITNDTISVSLPISAGTGMNSIIEGEGTTANGYSSHAEGYNTQANGDVSHAEGNYTTASGEYSHAEGNRTTASGDSSHAEGEDTMANGYSSHAEGSSTRANGNYSHAEGGSTKANGNYSHAEGSGTIANNKSEHASGQFNVSSSASTTFGDSGNTLFSVGNGTSVSARHNAFEIRQNGDIYLSLNGQDVKLQDQLRGSSITVDTALDSGSTNPVENRVIYNKIDEVEQVTAAGLNALNDNFGGLKLVKLTQAEYNALATKDSSTLYIIVN